MTAEVPAVPDRIPGKCGNCASADVHPHCPSPVCTWAKCGLCRAVTAVIGGVLRVVGGVAGLP